MQELICISAFLYHYIDSSLFPEVARREGATTPLNPPLQPSIKPFSTLPATLGHNYR